MKDFIRNYGYVLIMSFILICVGISISILYYISIIKNYEQRELLKESIVNKHKIIDLQLKFNELQNENIKLYKTIDSINFTNLEMIGD